MADDTLFLLLEYLLNADIKTISLIVIGLMFFWQLRIQRLIYPKIYDLKKTKFATLMQFVEEVLLEIEDQSVINSAKFFKREVSLACNCEFEQKYKESQEILYRLLLSKSLFINVRNRIKLKLLENGFYSKEDKDLEEYIEENAILLLHSNRRDMRPVIDIGIPVLKNTELDRFTEAEAIAAFRKIIYKAKEIKVQELREIEIIKNQHNPLGILFSIFRRKSKSLNDKRFI